MFWGLGLHKPCNNHIVRSDSQWTLATAQLVGPVAKTEGGVCVAGLCRIRWQTAFGRAAVARGLFVQLPTCRISGTQ